MDKNLRILILCTLLILAGCGREQEKEEPRLPVTVMIAAPDVISRIVMVPCRIEAAQEAVIMVSSSCRVEEVLIAEGTIVREGDVLVRLSTDDAYSSYVNSAAALVSAARSAAEFSEANLARAAGLLDSGAISPSDYDSALYGSEAARATLSQAYTGYQQALASAGSGLVAAPFDGVVARVLARPGNPAVGPLVAISGTGLLRAELMVPERYLPMLREGLPVFFATPHFPGEIFPGSVVSASGSVDPVSGLVPIVAQFPDSRDCLVPGISGMATIVLETSLDAVVLPGNAMLPAAGGTWQVALIEDNAAVIVTVETGIRQGNRWEIVSGIEHGDSVIVLGNHLADDGKRVEVVVR
jgi:membrane fusion protein (multidrug efflux system)